jgi:hypothetical protein
MSQSMYPVAPGSTGMRPATIVVEVGPQKLPPRMRMGGLRRTVHLPHVGTGTLRRVLMAPVAMMVRLLSR